MPQLEIACFTPAAAITASQAGAHRIELCRQRNLGGTTPTLETLQQVKEQISSIPVFVMIRPRGGDFIYSAAEFAEMKDDILRFKDLADGFVFGVLLQHSQGKRVDVLRTAELVKAAEPKPCTFHRAFDFVEDKSQGLEDVVAAGCRSILTSGGVGDAVDGVEVLAELVQRAAGRVSIIAGGGVRAANVRGIREKAGVEFLHSSAVLDGSGDEPDGEEIRRLVVAVRESRT